MIELNSDSNSSQQLTSSSSVNTTSGTAIDFTGIPGWVKRITVMFNGVSTNGTSQYQVQLGAGSIDTSGYSSSGTNGASGVAESTTGLLIVQSTIAASVQSGQMILSTMGSNIWVSSSILHLPPSSMSICAGIKTLSGTLDRIRITTVNGTDTFDAGSINILYE